MNEKIKIPAPLTPKSKMGRNEPCWCGSGRKWKHCHREREAAPRPNYFDAAAKQRANFSVRTCMHPEAPQTCEGPIVRAHTLQRATAMTAIAESGHVISVKAGIDRIFQNNGTLVPQKCGINEASTFTGFCNKHDTSIFKYIEHDIVPIDKRSAFLFAFRAVCLEAYLKSAASRSNSVLNVADSGLSLEQQAGIQDYIAAFDFGTSIGLKEVEEAKSKLDEVFRLGDFEDSHYVAVEFDGPIPVICCGGFQPEIDFAGVKLQDLMEVGLEHITYTLTYSGGRSLAILSWVGSEQGAAARFAKSFSSLPDSQKASAAVALALTHLENTHMRPSWWAALPQAEQERAIEMIHAGVPRPFQPPLTTLMKPGLISHGMNVAVASTTEA